MANEIGLSDREVKIASLLMQGKSNKQIAAELNISTSTVEFHLTNLYSKLGVGSRSEAIIQLSHLGETPGAQEDRELFQELGAPGKDSGKSPVGLGKFPIGNQGKEVKNKGRSNSPVVEAPDMTTSTNPPSANYRAQIFVIVVLSLVIIFGGYLLLKLGTASNIEKVEVTRLVPAEVTRLVKVTRIVQVTSTFTTLDRVQTVEITPGINFPDTLAHHTLTRLVDGRILITGGSRLDDQHVDRVAIYDPSNNTLTPVSPLHTRRHDHSATLLPDGRVLVVGGYNLPQQWLADAEIYDPVADSWTVIPPLYPHGVGHSATLMEDGRVLVVGGCIGDSVCTGKVEIFDPQTDSWTEAASLKTVRSSHSAQLLKDGRVLIAGGDWLEDQRLLDGSATIYDPQTNTWSATAPMVTSQVQAKSVLLPNGDVLVAGGILGGEVLPVQIISDTEIYDPNTDTWTSAANLNVPRYDFVMSLLPNGRAIVIGGARDYNDRWNVNSFVHEIEMYNPSKDRWEVVGELAIPTVSAAAVILPDNRLWVTGGQIDHDIFSSATWMIQLMTH